VLDTQRQLLLSIKPRYAQAILCGEKTVELRRVRPRLTVPTEALLYASTPVRAIVGTCHVIDVVEHTPGEMWSKVGQRTGITKQEFRVYFDGCKTAYGLIIANPTSIDRPVELNSLRANWLRFQPPQSFRYLTMGQSQRLLGMDQDSARLPKAGRRLAGQGSHGSDKSISTGPRGHVAPRQSRETRLLRQTRDALRINS
jgi:predicted transcriptional regulator